jgi:transposase
MSKARLVVTAITLEKRTVAEVVDDYGVSRSWVYELLARYRTEGQAAFEPRSRRPHTSARTTDQATVELVLRLRKQLTESGLDAGGDTIGWHLTHHHHQVTLCRATINRILVRNGAVVPDPSKRPKSSYLRFQAEQPNETWQSDFTHYPLTNPDGSRHLNGLSPSTASPTTVVSGSISRERAPSTRGECRKTMPTNLALVFR